MPKFAGFCGPSYLSRSGIVTSDELIGMYPEKVASGTGKDAYALYPVPGYTPFTSTGGAPVVLAGGPCRGMVFASAGPGVAEYVYVVAGPNVYKIDAFGNVTLLGTVATANQPAQIIVINYDQLFILSGGNAYNVVPSTATISSITLGFTAATATYLDTYIIANKLDSRQWYISNVGDPTTWNALNVATKESSADFLQGVFACNGFLYLFGLETTEIWYDSGASNFPFQRSSSPGGVIDQGCSSSGSIVKIDNTVMFVGRDTRGQAVVYELQGLTPRRVSNHAIEALLNTANNAIGNCIAFAYQEDGHSFYVLNLQDDAGLNITLVYDVTEQMWHKRGIWGGSSYTRVPLYFHAFSFFAESVITGPPPLHLVGGFGSWSDTSCTIYQQSTSLYTYAGNPIRWQRTTPHLYDGQHRVRYDRLVLDWDKTGTPTVNMAYSNDGGVSYGNTHTVTAQTGSARTIWRQLGSGRDRVFNLWGTVVDDNAIADAYIDVTPQSPPE